MRLMLEDEMDREQTRREEKTETDTGQIHRPRHRHRRTFRIKFYITKEIFL